MEALVGADMNFCFHYELYTIFRISSDTSRNYHA
ncbi:hypothetical protein ACUXQ2_001119 [Cupriavidus metallidurans]|jgi:hypothetical protein